MKRVLLAILAAAFWAGTCLAQQPVVPYLQGTAPALPAPVTGANPLPTQTYSGGAATSSGNPLPVAVGSQATGQFPLNSTPITGAAQGTTGAVTATLTSAASNTTYICGFSVTAVGGSATFGPVTISNTLTSNMIFYGISSTSGTNLSQIFSPCVPATGAATNITIATTADGTASNVAVNAWGFNTTAASPYNFTSITGNAAGAGGAVVGTLAGVANKTTYICGFSVSAIGGTATVAPITIAGLVTGSMVYRLNSAVASATLLQQFSPCIPASTTNTPITTTTTADGTATAVDVNSWGFQQ